MDVRHQYLSVSINSFTVTHHFFDVNIIFLNVSMNLMDVSIDFLDVSKQFLTCNTDNIAVRHDLMNVRNHFLNVKQHLIDVKTHFLIVKIDLFDVKSFTNSHLQDSHPAKPGFSGRLMGPVAAKRSRREAVTTRATTTPKSGRLSIFWVRQQKPEVLLYRSVLAKVLLEKGERGKGEGFRLFLSWWQFEDRTTYERNDKIHMF